MSFGRQKRLLIGWLALLAPLPLPLSDVIGWPVVILYSIGVLFFLRRAWLDPARWLPLWGLNVLGFAYLPLLGADLLVFHRGHLVAPVLHLGLFALLVKLFAMVRERDKWQVGIGVFFIFLASMGTSSHPTIVLYLTAFLVLSLVLLMRFAFLHVLADFSRDDPSLAAMPVGRLVAVSTVIILLLAVPLFAVLPRLRSPYIIGRGNGSGLVQEAAGFSDAVTLDSIDQIRTSRAVAIRVQFESGGPPGIGEDLRFKAATYDRYSDGRWQRTRMRNELLRRPGGLFVLGAGHPDRWLHVFLQPLHSRSLPLPVETLQVDPKVTGLVIDGGGALAFAFSPLELRDYRVGIGKRPVLLSEPPAGASDPTLDTGGLTPHIAALAARVAGRGTAGERAARLERHLSENYVYTLDLAGRTVDDNPIESFLFRYKSGQCEYFASAMVLMLRAQGVPARLVTGFLGGEYNPFEGFLILRDSNAHAWVEAYLGPAQGWQIFDPTPPAGRPAETSAGVWLLTRQAWDFVQFRWDRYVLTYGIYDQVAFFGQLRRLWGGLLGFFDRAHPEPPPLVATPGATAAAALPAAAPAPDQTAVGALLRSPWAAVAAVALLAAAALVWRRLRPPLDATLAYTRVRSRLLRAGLRVPPATAPLALQSLAAARFPAAAAPTAHVVALYLRESFGGGRLAEGDRAALRSSLVALDAQLPRSARAAARAAG